MTTLPASMAHVGWDHISLSEGPKCKSWSPPWLPLINPVLQVNDFFQVGSVMVLLKDIHGKTGAELVTLTVLHVILFSL